MPATAAAGEMRRPASGSQRLDAPPVAVSSETDALPLVPPVDGFREPQRKLPFVA
jgi:hypothetical protein